MLNRIVFFLSFFFCLSAFHVHAVNIDFNSPAGTYYFITVNGDNLKLILLPSAEPNNNIYRYKGRAEIYVGTQPTPIEGDYDVCYLASPPEKSKCITFSFPTDISTFFHYQFIMDREGWIYPIDFQFEYPVSEPYKKKRLNKTPASKTLLSKRINSNRNSVSSVKQYNPLKVSDFVSNEKLDMGDEIMDFTEINIEPEFMKKEGFEEGRKSRYIRPDVIVWSEDIAHYAGATYSIYLKFNTEAAAKAFFKTGEELGWKYSNPDTWTNNHLVLHAEVSRDGDLVEISLSHH